MRRFHSKRPLQISLVCFGVYLMCRLYFRGESSENLPGDVFYDGTDSRAVGTHPYRSPAMPV